MAEEGEVAVEFDFDDDAEGMDMDEGIATLQQEREKHRQRCAFGTLCSRPWMLTLYQQPGAAAHDAVGTGITGLSYLSIAAHIRLRMSGGVSNLQTRSPCTSGRSSITIGDGSDSRLRAILSSYERNCHPVTGPRSNRER